MTPYKGIVRITCRDKTCKNKLTQPVAECVNCDRARLEILDLDGMIVAQSAERRAQSVKVTGKKPLKGSKIQRSLARADKPITDNE